MLDTKSKLTWQQTVSATLMTWAAAKTYCAGVGSTLGGTGWRLPTIKELQSLLDYTQTAAPLIDSTAFPGTSASGAASFFWSSTPGASSFAWELGFNSGGRSGTSNVADTNAVRCVR